MSEILSDEECDILIGLPSIEEFKAAHAELMTIHKIGMCIAECPPIIDSDTLTVKMVKEMAIRINQNPEWK